MLASLACLLGTAVPMVDRVLVIENSASPVSVEIAADYTKRRKVRKVLKVRCQDSAESAEKETIQFSDFQKSIETPLRDYLKDHPEIDFIVLTKGVPIRIQGASIGAYMNQPSLDSYLAALNYGDRRGSMQVPMGRNEMKGLCWANRFWNSKTRFSHRLFGGYLVTRLDGYTVEDAKALTTRSLAADKLKPTGPILLDAQPRPEADRSKIPMSLVSRNENGEVQNRGLGYGDWDLDIVVAAERLKERKLPVELDATEAFVGQKMGLMGYVSWGSNDPKFTKESYASIGFAPGGIAETAVSSSARTFLPTTGGQSLIADLIRQGAAGAKGYCNEPFLQAVASPTILFDRYTRGWTLAESFFAASRYVSWEDIVIGDPLCSPYG